MSPDPQHIAISKSKEVRIVWKDGHQSQYPLKHLRDHCPCASCANAHGSAPVKPQDPSPFQLYKPALKIDSVEPVGNYALRIQWNDGHRTGIYSFEHFRRICPCPECAQAEIP